MERETVIYKGKVFQGLATQRYEKDLKLRQKEGWQLVSCTESGKDLSGQPILTAIYERGTAAPGPAMNVQNLPLLLSMLSPQEKEQFEAEVQVMVNRWLAAKAMAGQQ